MPATWIDAGNLAIAQHVHDLRNLLTIIVGCAECLCSQVPDGRADRECAELRLSTARAVRLTRELLMSAAPRTGRRSVVDLNQVVVAIAETFGTLPADNLSVQLRLSADAVPVVADVADLERILLNLALNARDAMAGGGVLTIETALIADETCDGHAQPGVRARLTVTDTGCGIPAGHKQRILEPFFTTKELGTGLGLTTVAHTVRQLQGALSVDSQPGIGTCVTIDLPLADLESVTLRG